MSETSGKAWDTSLYKRVLRYVNPYKKTFYITGFLVVLLAILTPIRPKLIQVIVDEEVAAGNAEGVLNLTLILMVLLVVEAVIQFYQTYMANILIERQLELWLLGLFQTLKPFPTSSHKAF